MTPPIELPRPQERFAVYGSRIFKPSFSFAKFDVGGFRLANSSERYDGNTEYKHFHRGANLSQTTRTRANGPKFRSDHCFVLILAVMSDLPPKADVRSATRYVCFGPKADISQISFDHLVGAALHRLRHRNAQRLCGLEIDDQLNFR